MIERNLWLVIMLIGSQSPAPLAAFLSVEESTYVIRLCCDPPVETCKGEIVKTFNGCHKGN
jgi:hypothetical protein